MKLALVVIGDGRGEYLDESVRAATRHIMAPISSRIMVDDSGDLEYGTWLDRHYPEFIHVHGGRRGMAGAVQAGFDAALEQDPDYVCWIEEDMLLTRDLPIAGAAQALNSHPELAQMIFPREAIDPSEGDDQLKAKVAQAANSGEREQYTWHDFIFSMNPCLIPKRVLELGWSKDNEAGMTAKLLDAGYLFADWGHVGGDTYARHIGYANRSAGYRL